MGSESETRDLEVRKARTRTRSKQKHDIEDADLKSIDSTLDTTTTNACSNGTSGSGFGIKKLTGGKSQKKLDTSKEGDENGEAMNTEKVRKTRRGKRSSSKKNASEDNNTNGKETASKRVKKESAEANDDEEHETDVPEESNDVKKPKKPSQRQIKREKAEQRETLRKEASRLEATEKALNYVSKWKHAKSEWKFEKLRQIWLMDHLLDDELIPDDIFPTVLEYFEGCKGMAREQLLKKGMDVIRKQEGTEETQSDEQTTESVEYKRARQLLQALPTET